MTNDELIEILKNFNKPVELLDDEARKLFDTIMRVIDERDKYIAMYETEKKIVVAYELKIMELEKELEKCTI